MDDDEKRACIKCGEDKPLSAFSPAKTLAGYRAECRACRSAAIKARLQTPEGKAAYKKSQHEHYERNKETIKAKVRQYQHKNAEKVRIKDHEKYVKNRLKRRQQNADWAARNVDKMKARGRAYYASLGDIMLSESEANLILSHGCLFCGKFDHLVLAHDVPSRKGGLYDRANLFCLCASCNSRMRQKTLADMLEQPPLFGGLLR